MDYEEFNKEYKSFSDWWDAEGNDVLPMNNKNVFFGSGVLGGASEDTVRYSVPSNNIQRTGWIPDDRVNSPSHYTSGRMEAIDIIEDAISTAPTPAKGLLQAQVLKYILRLWLKDSPVEDAKKAEWYLRRLIDSLE